MDSMVAMNPILSQTYSCSRPVRTCQNMAPMAKEMKRAAMSRLNNWTTLYGKLKMKARLPNRRKGFELNVSYSKFSNVNLHPKRQELHGQVGPAEWWRSTCWRSGHGAEHIAQWTTRVHVGQTFDALTRFNQCFLTEIVQRDQVQVVITGILERWTGKVERCEVLDKVSPIAHEQTVARTDQQNAVEHGEYFVGGRRNGHDHNATTDQRPLTQVLHQEETIENVQSGQWLVQDENVRIQDEVNGNVKATTLREGQLAQASMFDFTQIQFF